MIANSSSDTEIFAVVTQFYVRLRRVSGRVADVSYMVENQEYAKHLLRFAETIEDVELQKHVSSLNALITSGKSEVVITDNEIVAAPAEPNKTSSRNHQNTWFLG